MFSSISPVEIVATLIAVSIGTDPKSFNMIALAVKLESSRFKPSKKRCRRASQLRSRTSSTGPCRSATRLANNSEVCEMQVEFDTDEFRACERNRYSAAFLLSPQEAEFKTALQQACA
jgi:hypothetical protein